jgi:hypothetical protein
MGSTALRRQRTAPTRVEGTSAPPSAIGIGHAGIAASQRSQVQAQRITAVFGTRGSQELAHETKSDRRFTLAHGAAVASASGAARLVAQRVINARVDFQDPENLMDGVDPLVESLQFEGRPNIVYMDGGGNCGQGDHVVAQVVFEHAVQNAVLGKTFTAAVTALSALAAEIRVLPGFATGSPQDRLARETAVQGMIDRCAGIGNGGEVVHDIRKPTVLAQLCETYINVRSGLRLVARNPAVQDQTVDPPSPAQNRLGARNLDEFAAAGADLTPEEVAEVSSAIWATFDYRPTTVVNGRAPQDAAAAVATLILSVFQAYPHLQAYWIHAVSEEMTADFLDGEGARWGWSKAMGEEFSETLQQMIH